MRSVLAGMLVVGLLVAPTFGAATIDVKLQVTKAGVPVTTLNVGDAALVEGWFKCTGAAVCAIGGNVTADAAGLSISGSLTPASFYASNFQGFQPGTATQIPPAAPVAGANGAVSGIGSAQPITDLTVGWDTTATYGNGVFVKLFSYTVHADAVGMVNLAWADAAGGYNGWYTTDTSGKNGIAANTGVTIAVVPTVVNRNLISSSVDYAVAGKKTFWRTKKNIVRLTFDQPLTEAPTAGQIKIFQCLAGGIEGPDLSSNFVFTLESGGTVVRCLDNSPNGVLVDHTWYAIGLGTLPSTNAFTKFTPVLVGDWDGRGVLTAAGDLNPIVAKLSSPSVAPNDADRRDLDGNMVVSAAADVNPVVVGLLHPTLWPIPIGWGAPNW